ncbi:MAG: triose-phosphate isomerase [Desulfobacterales bacterium]
MKNRRPFIAGNWKMFKTLPEAVETAKKLAELVQDVHDTDIMIAPPFISVTAVGNAVKGSPVQLGAQNLFWENEGAYTGEISASMLVSAGCTYVIVGHSERRQYFGETDESANKKIRAALTAGLVPILCVGETETERNAKNTFSVLDKQIKNGLKDFFSDELEKLVIAYEPVWAIGTGKTATAGQAQEVHEYLRSLVEKVFGISLAKSLRIQYGGSVKPDNIRELMQMPDVDGALVGGASLSAETFSKIVRHREKTEVNQ